MKKEPEVYLARAGRYGEDEDLALEDSMSIIGFREIPTLEQAHDYEAVLSLVTQHLPDRQPKGLANLARQLVTFVRTMSDGDIVVLPRKGKSQIAIGRVTGPYRYQEVNSQFRHTRPVKWIRTEVPRSSFRQDLLYSFGAFLTVCRISRNDAAHRVSAVLSGSPDPGPKLTTMSTSSTSDDDGAEELPYLPQLAHDQIVARIQSRFAGHSLTRLVDAVLRSEGWVTTVSPPGPDGGVDILAGSGSLGLASPRLCVQVKSQNSPADVTVYRTLQGTMQTFGADQGLLVCWGGFNQAVLKESKQAHFTVRLWDSGNLVEAIYRHYQRLPEEIQAELPLKRVWMLVPEEQDD